MAVVELSATNIKVVLPTSMEPNSSMTPAWRPKIRDSAPGRLRTKGAKMSAPTTQRQKERPTGGISPRTLRPIT